MEKKLGIMVLCDTNIFISAFNGRQDTIDEMDKIGFENIVISSITLMELYQGMKNKTELVQMKKKIKYFDVIDIDAETSKLATTLIEKFKLSHGLQIPDAIIGATSVIHRIPLFTYNLKDFNFIPNLDLYEI
ncbi:type II toxin-antitoxin system VapC family toxin [Arcicella lustrica]|uniref:Ribonuclease VapC n=2 Tax=Arcicella TaxID=217140 RepID=A0ABU5SD20_9BACT|nr:type II toxin-antitoxin system VapC family toxin [Arcicella sp. DC25W]MEA5425187.1 type II toxin-antitoxin system VapC family toxin [Arcicella sp. DC25W]